MKRKNLVALLLVLAGLAMAMLRVFPAADLIYPSSSSTGQSPVVQTPEATVVLGERIKADGCQVENSLPDNQCTPGAVFPDATAAQICTPGYSKSVRNVSSSVKNEAYAEYDVTTRSPGEYEVDHLVSLELGGSNDIANLWPEAADPRPGFHEKDQVENYLHDRVCSGKISLAQAQQEIATNWLAVYSQLSR